MKHRARPLVPAVAGVVIALTLSVPVAAAALVADPVGDALYGAPAFMDIVSAGLSEANGALNFWMTVAGTIPADPRLAPPAEASIRWAFPIDSDPTTFPAGAPLAPGQAGPAEFNIRVFWDGNAYSASLLDRRPLLNGLDPIVTPLAFTVSGADVRVAVPATLIGTPKFRWGAVTVDASAAPGADDGSHFVDTLQPFYNIWP